MAETHVTHHHPTRAETRGCAEVYALVIGILLTVVGLAGFFADAHFDSTHQESFIGLFDVNGWANLIHLIAGVLGLFAWKLALPPGTPPSRDLVRGARAMGVLGVRHQFSGIR